MFALLNRLFGSKLSTPVRVGLFVIAGVVVAFVFHDIVYGLVLGAIGGFGAWRQGRKTSFAAAPVVPVVPPAAPIAPLSTPPAAPPPTTAAGPPPPLLPPNEGPSIYGT